MDSIVIKLTGIIFLGTCFYVFGLLPVAAQNLKLNDLDYFEARGINILVFSNPPGGMFNDAKTSGVEVIHHGVRTVTNGDVRLRPTPGQWDEFGHFIERVIYRDENSIEAKLEYPDYNFRYTVQATAKDGGVYLKVMLDAPLPKELEGRAGFNLEFLPAEYFEKMYFMDGSGNLFPRHPAGLMDVLGTGLTEPMPLARGRTFIAAPGDPARQVTISSGTNDLFLFDGRNNAQNGWYVLRSMIPEGVSGAVVEWFLTAETISDWIRSPMIAYSQVGYHPDQSKRAIIEHDKNDTRRPEARLYYINERGESIEKHRSDVKEWGKYLRYEYAIYDFSEVKESGIYFILYGDQRTKPFRINRKIYEDAWHLTLDVFFPVQMDHMLVREAYRVWHGASHLDDALQAPVNYEHFDLYAQGPTTDTRFKPGEHIPGLNIGGWYDAGDYDIRTQSQYATVLNLVHACEKFNIDRDNTTVSQVDRYVEIHVPDGKSDILQQIEHGTLALIAQHRSIGHAIPGIIASHLYQYTHLGDGSTKTDNRIYNPDLDTIATDRFAINAFKPVTTAPRPGTQSTKTDGLTSGKFDDRWAFTSRSSSLNYGSAAALAAASRALSGFNTELAEECIATAIRVWDEEQNREPFLFRHGNTTGGMMEMERLNAAVELLITLKDQKYADSISELLPLMEERFAIAAILLMRALPYMDHEYGEKVEILTREYRERLERFNELNPFGVPITTGGWAGSGAVVNFAVTNYYLHKAFPEIIDSEYIFRGLNYIFGTHPGSNNSFVSGVGTESQLIAYGTNRADFSFIPGGVVPGVLILPPDLPENKNDWPFFWGQNEYVITLGASYLFLVHAVNDLLNLSD
jgi:endoglucanase